MHYKLVNRRAILCENLIEWGAWYARADRRVAETWIDDIRISTVFLGLGHNPCPNGDPALFETMAFVDGEPHQEVRRYFIWEEAETGHAETVALFCAAMAEARIHASAALEAVCLRLSRA